MSKKIMALLLALVLALSLAAPALAAEKKVFTDVVRDSWYSDAVDWATEKGIVVGYPDGSFGVGKTITEAEALTMFWRTMGEQEPKTPVEDTAYYAKPLAWAEEESGKILSEDDMSRTLNRIDFAQLLYYLCAEQSNPASASPFEDVSAEALPDYADAVEVVNWAVAVGVTEGTSETTFSPLMNVTREQAVTMLLRFVNKVAKDLLDGAVYTEKQVPVFRKELTDETITLRFYEDIPNVAYVSAADYHALMLPGAKLTVEDLGEGKFSLTTGTGTATVDVVNDVFTSPDFPAFTNVMSLQQEGIDNVYLDGAPFIRVNHVEYDKPADVVTFDFKKYGIELTAENGAVYFPIQTLSDMYSDLDYHYTAYNGEKVYVNDDNHIPEMFRRDPEYLKPILANKTRPADLAAYTYNELCFCLDNFYGYPGRAVLNDAMLEKGLDTALTEYSPAGVRTRELLLSTDPVEYGLGICRLDLLVDDGGHTYLDLTTSLNANESEDAAALAAAIQEAQLTMNGDMAELVGDNLITRVTQYSGILNRAEMRTAAYGDTTYFKKGDTAVCVFDSFNNINYDGWKKYYAGEAGFPEEKDDLAIFLDALNKANADPEVKNFVIDITNNGGGSLDVLITMLSLATGRNDYYCQNTLTGQTVRTFFDVDRNFDGKFDEKDAEVSYDKLTFAVLTSSYSFSCGNLLPSLMQDTGVMIIGEKSGGGSCAVGQTATGDGYFYRISSFRGRLVNDAGKNIDGGVPVDVDILDYNEDGSVKMVDDVYPVGDDGGIPVQHPDYSKFYDLELLGKIIVGYHTGQGENENAA